MNNRNPNSKWAYRCIGEKMNMHFVKIFMLVILYSNSILAADINLDLLGLENINIQSVAPKDNENQISKENKDESEIDEKLKMIFDEEVNKYQHENKITDSNVNYLNKSDGKMNPSNNNDEDDTLVTIELFKKDYFDLVNDSVSSNNSEQKNNTEESKEDKTEPIKVEQHIVQDFMPFTEIEENTIDTLSLISGNTLKEAVNKWSERNKIKLIWKINRDYYIANDASYKGNIYNIFNSLSVDLQGTNITFKYYKGNDVLIVEETKK